MSRLWTRPLRSLLFVTALLAALTIVACGGSSDDSGSGGGGGGKVTLVAYSTPQEAYEKIIPAFQTTPAGKDVKFDQSYGASGDQSGPSRAGCPPTSWPSPWPPTWTGSWTPTWWTRLGPGRSTTAS